MFTLVFVVTNGGGVTYVTPFAERRGNPLKRCHHGEGWAYLFCDQLSRRIAYEWDLRVGPQFGTRAREPPPQSGHLGAVEGVCRDAVDVKEVPGDVQPPAKLLTEHTKGLLYPRAAPTTAAVFDSTEHLRT